MKYAFDLHMHSCLSPCGGDDMTPATIAGLCALGGLEVIALTDHNTVNNCPAFLKACGAYGLVGLPGMELCTREEVHVVCLFPGMPEALAFQEKVFAAMAHLPPNQEEIFGHQLIMDEEDNVIARETRMLAGSADIGIYEVLGLARECGGTAYPAHIDRDAFSLLGNLGLWDPDMGFALAEVSRRCPEGFFDRPDLRGVPHIQGCDAHYMDQLMDAHQYMDLGEFTPRAALDWLRKGGPGKNLSKIPEN